MLILSRQYTLRERVNPNHEILKGIDERSNLIDVTHTCPDPAAIIEVAVAFMHRITTAVQKQKAVQPFWCNTTIRRSTGHLEDPFDFLIEGQFLRQWRHFPQIAIVAYDRVHCRGPRADGGLHLSVRDMAIGVPQLVIAERSWFQMACRGPPSPVRTLYQAAAREKTYGLPGAGLGSSPAIKIESLLLGVPCPDQ